MKKEKLSYFVLLAEVVVIIYLHSTKSPAMAIQEQDRQVAGSSQAGPQSSKIVHQVIYTGR